jgi:integrase/recombinase XerD
MSSFPCLVRSVSPAGETRYALGDPLVDRYLEFVAGRCRPNTLTATAFDLKTFFTVVDRDPVTVTPADVFEFLADQRGDRRVVRLTDRESRLSARTIARRLSTVSGFYAYLVARGDTPVGDQPGAAGSGDSPSGRFGDVAHGAVGAGAAHVAEDLVAGRGRRVAGCPTVVAGPGDGRSDAARRVAPL